MNERDNWWALREYEDALCPQCKRLRSVCENEDQDWYPQKHWCGVMAAQQVASRKFQELNRNVEPDGAGYLPTDGTVVWVADDDLTPNDEFLMSPIERAAADLVRNRPRLLDS